MLKDGTRQDALVAVAYRPLRLRTILLAGSPRRQLALERLAYQLAYGVHASVGATLPEDHRVSETHLFAIAADRPVVLVARSRRTNVFFQIPLLRVRLKEPDSLVL